MRISRDYVTDTLDCATSVGHEKGQWFSGVFGLRRAAARDEAVQSATGVGRVDRLSEEFPQTPSAGWRRKLLAVSKANATATLFTRCRRHGELSASGQALFRLAIRARQASQAVTARNPLLKYPTFRVCTLLYWICDSYCLDSISNGIHAETSPAKRGCCCSSRAAFAPVWCARSTLLRSLLKLRPRHLRAREIVHNRYVVNELAEKARSLFTK